MKYCTATPTGLGFYTHADRELAHLSSHPGNVWAVGDANHAWIARVGGTEKTKAEAQALVRASDTLARTAWDNNNVDDESADDKVVRIGAKPGFQTIP